MSNKRFYLIDATAFCYRAFYALRGLVTSFGQPTNAIFGFTNMLNKILREKKPEYLAICFDVSRDTFRKKKFSEYKLNRPAMPEGLASQMPYIKDIVCAYGITIYEKEGFEADDLIATLAKKAKCTGMGVIIVSSDKDILQLVDDSVTVFSPYKDSGISYDVPRVIERYGLKPSQIADLIVLMGDSIDNLPGVPGIGEKTAIELVNEFGSLDAILAHIDQIKQEHIKVSLRKNIDTVRMNKDLVRLDDAVDIDFDTEKLRVGKPDYHKLFRLFKHLEFKKLLSSLPAGEEAVERPQVSGLEEKVLKDVFNGVEEVFLYGDDDGFVCSAKENTFALSIERTETQAMLADERVRKIGHDLKRLRVVLAQENIALKGLYFDVMVAAYLLNPSRPTYSLVEIAWDYLPELTPMKKITNVQAIDLIRTLRVKLENELQDKALIGLFQDLEMPLEEVLAEMELAGIRLDMKLLAALSSELERRLIRLVEDIYRVSGRQFNINSPKQLRNILFEELKLPVIKRTKTGPSTDEGVLKALAPSHALPALLLEYRQFTKLKSTYVDALPALVNPRTGRLHTSFNQTTTETGRLSSTNPNLQNIPIRTDIGKKIRQAVIASSDDSYLLTCDYSQIELRILAHLCGDENLRAAFKTNKDVHRATASLLYGTDESGVSDEMREVAKRVNFGIVYGLTAFGLARDLGISTEEAQNFIDAYFLRYPRVKVYISEQIKKAEQDGFVTTMLGRRRYLPDIHNKNQAIKQFAQRQAVNTPIQGSASDLIKLAMVQIHSRIKEKGFRAQMILQVHDELVFDVPRNEFENFTFLVRDRMEHVLELEVPVKVTVRKGKNWLEMEDVK